MSRKLLTVLITLGIMGMVTGLAAKAPPKQVTLDKCKKKKPGVAFDHEAHSKKHKIKCDQCHKHKDGKKKKGKCSDAKCHAGKAADKKPGCAEASLKKNPYHIKCVGCHKKNKKGPKKCKECHKK